MGDPGRRSRLFLCFFLLSAVSFVVIVVRTFVRQFAIDAIDSSNILAFTVPDHKVDLRENGRNVDFASSKKILLFTTQFGVPGWWFPELGHAPFVSSADCPVKNCFVTANRSLLSPEGGASDFDAVLFHPRDIDLKDLPDPARRRSDQRYIMFTMETPLADSFDYATVNGLFNWTMTYRSDSDISTPYNWFVEKEDPLEQVETWEKYVPKKFFKKLRRSPPSFRALADRPNLIAWLVSNCGTASKREKYVDELRRHIRVDVFGACGNECGDRGTQDCADLLRSNYKFVLAFENALCDDYVTEKFFDAMTSDLVPIVLGKADYSELAPPHSYVNAMDFRSPELLAKFLRKLDENAAEYLSYFWWKEKYMVGHGRSRWCFLCEMLHVDLPSKVYGDMEEWWRGGGGCEEGPFPWVDSLEVEWSEERLRALEDRMHVSKKT